MSLHLTGQSLGSNCLIDVIVLFQQGKCMIRNVNTTQWYFHYMSDILTTCIDLQWRYTILIFVLLYVARSVETKNEQIWMCIT